MVFISRLIICVSNLLYHNLYNFYDCKFMILCYKFVAPSFMFIAECFNLVLISCLIISVLRLIIYVSYLFYNVSRLSILQVSKFFKLFYYLITKWISAIRSAPFDLIKNFYACTVAAFFFGVVIIKLNKTTIDENKCDRFGKKKQVLSSNAYSCWV